LLLGMTAVSTERAVIPGDSEGSRSRQDPSRGIRRSSSPGSLVALLLGMTAETTPSQPSSRAIARDPVLGRL
jgi:hypothetical protein